MNASCTQRMSSFFQYYIPKHNKRCITDEMIHLSRFYPSLLFDTSDLLMAWIVSPVHIVVQHVIYNSIFTFLHLFDIFLSMYHTCMYILASSVFPAFITSYRVFICVNVYRSIDRERERESCSALTILISIYF